MMKQLVSIIVPCYNQAQYLDEALQSVLDQTYSNWECIIVNDGSTDDTASIVKDWLTKDKRFCYLEQENNGVSNARNSGIARSEGEFILPLDADDFLSENYLEECLRKIKNNNIKVVYGKGAFFGDQDGELPLLPASLENLLKQNCIHCSGLFRKKDWKLNNGYDANMIHGFEDWEFWINILKRGGRALLVDQCVLNYRIKFFSRSTDVNSNVRKYEEMIDYIFKKHINLYGFSSTYAVFREKLILEERLKNIPSNHSYIQIIVFFFKKIKLTFNRLKK